MADVVENAGKTPELSHSFYLKAKDLIESGDVEQILKEKLHTKLLRLCPYAQKGFVLTDFPNSVSEAEVLETFKNGISSFVHLSLPDEVLVDLEESKFVCNGCGKQYFTAPLIDLENGIRIDPFLPDNGVCFDCGSSEVEHGSDPIGFEKHLSFYKDSRQELLQFYDHYVSKYL